MSLDRIILKNLIHNEEYTRKVLPFLKTEYFQSLSERNIFNEINLFLQKYNTLPSIEALCLAVSNSKDSQHLVDDSIEILSTLLPEEANAQWLLDSTEQFCQDKAIYNAVLESIQILDGKSKTQEKGAIPKILADALGVGFDTNVGHDYIEDAASRFDFYHKKENRIPFDLEFMNIITKGGLPSKTLNVALAGTGVGKSLFMCHVASGFMTQGKNVLYITLEMAEERIAERIDANLLNVDLDDLITLPKDIYEKKVARIRQKSPGKLIIKEYPTSAASTMHFRSLLNELNLKKNFVPDVIFIDYVGIMKLLGNYKEKRDALTDTCVALRGLAKEFNISTISVC